MNIFTYGTLMIPSVMNAVTGGDFRSEKATLRGYARYRVKGEVYPGIVPDSDACVDGVVYQDVDEASVERLDTFEGQFYERVRVSLETPAGGALGADTYVVRPENGSELSTQPWEFEHFRAEGLERFLGSYSGFRAIAEPEGEDKIDA